MVIGMKYTLALRRGSVYYFRISAQMSDGSESLVSPIYYYNPEGQPVQPSNFDLRPHIRVIHQRIVVTFRAAESHRL